MRIAVSDRLSVPYSALAHAAPTCLPLPPVPSQGPRRAGRGGHGGAKLPTVGLQLAEDPLDQRRFAAEQMDDIRNIQQHALGKNVRIDSHQGRELLAPRRHGCRTSTSGW